jgi:hypothetical protein
VPRPDSSYTSKKARPALDDLDTVKGSASVSSSSVSGFVCLVRDRPRERRRRPAGSSSSDPWSSLLGVSHDESAADTEVHAMT